MPLVNGKKVQFDPRKIAEYIHYGYDVQPDVNDAEDTYLQQERIRTESEMIWKALEQHYPDTFKRLNNRPTYQSKNMLASLRPGINKFLG